MALARWLDDDGEYWEIIPTCGPLDPGRDCYGIGPDAVAAGRVFRVDDGLSLSTSTQERRRKAGVR
jgi:hypothetical protein